jgi:hypothetical protein
MWTSRSQTIGGGRGSKYEIDRNGVPMTFQDVLDGWQDDAGFRSFFNTLLASPPYAAFRWETPMWTADTLSNPFECVLLDDPGLSRRPDPEAFAEHFGDAKAGVAQFANFRGDATMVVPCPVGDDSAYGHLAAFVRLAPERQRHSLWKLVGQTMMQRIGRVPVWLSTAGAGVSWLHVRLDDRPKYYGHRAYAAQTAT